MKKSSTFIRCGFEFTASPKIGIKPKAPLYTYTGDNNLHYNNYRGGISKYKWINESFDGDECGCEVSTPIIANKDDVSRVFDMFKTWANSKNLTLDINKAKCGLGGCHIHMEMPKLPIVQRRLFLKNIAILLTNYPQLNWGFNDPNDNYNANSLLAECEDQLNLSSAIFRSNYDNIYCLVSLSSDRWSSSSKTNVGSYLYPYRNERSPLTVFLNDPFKVTLHKKFAIRYNENYKTVEIRIMDMPKTLKQHLLHHDVAKAIYNYCLKATLKGQLLKLNYTKYSEYQFTEKEAINEFYKVLNLLDIEKSRTNKMIGNIKLRYYWNRIQKKENYLL